MDPTDMNAWKSLASYHSSKGDLASANVALARGYQARGSMGIAKGKVRLALQHDAEHEEAMELAKVLEVGR